MSKKRKKAKDQDQPEHKVEPKYKVKTSCLLDPEEVAQLIAASTAPYEDAPPTIKPTDYPTYSKEEALDLIAGVKRRRRKHSQSESR